MAWKYFQTPRRKYIVADCRGHEQYARNMVTGASPSDVALLPVDARKGVREQTQGHLAIVRPLGMRRVLVVMNKVDRVDWDRRTFEGLAGEVGAFAERLGVTGVDFVPASALLGENLARLSTLAPWYRGLDGERRARSGLRRLRLLAPPVRRNPAAIAPGGAAFARPRPRVCSRDLRQVTEATWRSSAGTS